MSPSRGSAVFSHPDGLCEFNNSILSKARGYPRHQHPLNSKDKPSTKKELNPRTKRTQLGRPALVFGISERFQVRIGGILLASEVSKACLLRFCLRSFGSCHLTILTSNSGQRLESLSGESAVPSVRKYHGSKPAIKPEAATILTLGGEIDLGKPVLKSIQAQRLQQRSPNPLPAIVRNHIQVIQPQRRTGSHGALELVKMRRSDNRAFQIGHQCSAPTIWREKIAPQELGRHSCGPI